MAESAKTNLYDGVWHAQQFQLIAFPLESQIGLERSWWEELAGNSDVESVRKKNSRVDSGVFNGTTLQLNIDPLRMAWVMTRGIPTESIESGIPEPPDIGSFEESRNLFAPLMDHWLKEFCPPIARLAFVSTLTQWTQNREESYAILDKYLHDVDVDPESTDFQYRINRKRDCASAGIPGLVINRLSTWSAIKITLSGVSITVTDEKTTSIPRSTERLFCGCQLQLDINTAPEFGAPLPQTHLAKIWDELVALGSEIAERGDIR